MGYCRATASAVSV